MAEKKRWSVFPNHHNGRESKNHISEKPKQTYFNIKIKSLLLVLFNIALIGIYVYSYGTLNILDRINYSFTTLEIPVIFESIILLIFSVLTLIGIFLLVYFSIKDLVKPASKSERTTLHSWYETKFDVDIVIIVVVLIRLIIQPFSVYGSSMEPNFHNHEYIIVNEVSYRLHKPSRGDVIVFKFPDNKNKIYIKRIIGLPNEQIVVKDNQVVVYNHDYPSGIELRESYIPSETKTLPRNNQFSDVTLSNNEYYVMGDNRQASSDSREWGPLASDLIIGRSWVICWPFSDWQVIKTPSYNLTTFFNKIYTLKPENIKF
jgi:signal peptidase I